MLRFIAAGMCRRASATVLLGLVAAMALPAAHGFAVEAESPKLEVKKPDVAVGVPTDVLRDAVDPYNPGAERSRFLAAAGVDTELTEGEFNADAKRVAEGGKGFARRFDRWAMLIKFDGNRDGQIDWFEADAYRKALRAAVMRGYNITKDNRLTGEERNKANQALAAGKVPAIAAPGRPKVQGEATRTPVFSDPYRGIQWDTDGDGKMSAEERKAYQAKLLEIQKKMRADYLEKYDTNRDGKVDGDERNGYIDDMRRQSRERQAQFVRDWDKDGDGKVRGDELKAYHQHRAEQWKKRDPKGFARAQKAREKMQAQHKAMLEKHDANGNGRLDGDEWKKASEERMAEWRRDNPEQAAAYDKRMKDYHERQAKLEKEFDGDGDGKLSDEERKVMYKTVRDRYNQKRQAMLEKYDANGNGRLDGDEREKAKANGDIPTWGHSARATPLRGVAGGQ